MMPATMASRVTSPIVIGRVPELELLDGMVARAAQGDGAGTVLIGGEAGIGKSRLAAELKRRATDAGAIVLEGGCVSLGSDEALPFAPVAEALRGLVRDVPPDDLLDLFDASTSEVARLVPVVASEPAVVGSDNRPDWAQTRIFESLLALLERLGERAPVLLVVEDLHWADRSTRELLAFLVRNLREGRIMLALTYRTDELHRRHPLRPWIAEIARMPRVARLELEPFTDEEIAAQVEAILDGPPEPGTVATVVRRSGGNPFFAEELIAAGITGEHDRLPASLRDVLLVRIHGLSDEAQVVVRCAAVAGQQVDHELLETACVGECDISGGLREAVAAQLLVARDEVVPTYAFRHALVREATYDDTLPLDRREWHARFAEALAARPVPPGAAGASQLSALAHHATAAHDLPRALRGWIDAARASAAVYALAEAADAYERALELWDATPPDDRPGDVDLVQLHHDASLALIGTGSLLRAREVAGLAVARFPSAQDPLRAALLRERYARTQWLAGDLAGGLASLDEAQALVRGLPPSPEVARVFASLAGMLVLRDQNRRAIEVGRQAVELSREVGAPAVESYALCGLGVATVGVGDCDTGLAMLRRALDMAHELQMSVIDFHRAYANLSTGLQVCGELEASVACAVEGVAWAKGRGLWRLQGAFLEANAAAALMDLGRWDEARAMLDIRDRPITEGVALLNHALTAGVLSVRTGRLGEARRLLAPARAATSTLGDAQFTGPITLGAVELALADGRLDDAMADADEGLWRMTGTEDTGIRFGLEIIGQALRACGLALAEARLQRDADRQAELRARADRWVALAAGMRERIAGPERGWGGESRGFALLVDAEAGELAVGPDPARWAEAADWFEAMPRHYPAAVARLRQAEAILATTRSRVDAAVPLLEALRVARMLGARPLEQACVALARIARIELPAEGDPATPATPATSPADGASPAGPASPAEPERWTAASHGLTPREVEVLELLVEGYSNRRIAAALYMSESTAGVHVSNILGKLGVSGRVEAAALAVRQGLVG
jgi:DNA-binding CsgD family transcriptional regulator